MPVIITGLTAKTRRVDTDVEGANKKVSMTPKERIEHLRNFLGITVDPKASRGRYVWCEFCDIKITLESAEKSTRRGGFYNGNLKNHLVRDKHEQAIVLWVEDNNGNTTWQHPEKVREWAQRRFPPTTRPSSALASMKDVTPSVQKRTRRVKARSSLTPAESRPTTERKRRQRKSVSPLFCL
ncbi:hypothetical protein FA15DRAFT_460979 [Coprinopsis marcescibilis]|uniref:Uncharacterized protein n=1 Tax=Coprinopsis marcescibilis TaxID=230819 RepID=A0A5C3KSQ7_COPMA|nr:hypothetical protein FA15DRAFT_460979 [Coprinopsis marcescibilis]